MPASLPGSTLAQNQGTPTLGPFVLFDGLSGPKGSPFDAKKIDYATAPPAGLPAGWTAQRIPLKIADPLNLSTGQLSTGVGFGATVIAGVSHPLFSNSVWGLHLAGFTDDYTPGVSTPTPAAAIDSRYLYVGGGRSNASGAPTPYTAGFGIAGAGQGAAREAGAVGFGIKSVTAPGAVAIGAVVEAGFVNRATVPLANNQSTFGSAAAAFAVPA